MRFRNLMLAGVVVAVSFGVALKAFDVLSPRRAAEVKRPDLPPLPPLPEGRTSTLIVPVAISLPALRDLAERAAPKTFAGKVANPAPQVLQDADIAWTAARGPIVASGAQNQLAMTAPLTGSVAVKGALSANATGAVGDALGKLLGGNVAKQIGVNIKNFNANGDIKGTIAITARPTLLPNWRVEPNLTAQAVLGDSTVSIAGARLNVPGQVKPFIDKAVNDQLAAVQQRIRDDAALETNARREWTKLCRSIPLQGIAVQGLWLELRPTRALAAQPKIDAGAVTLTMGVAAETRVTPAQTKPDCPFPATLEFVSAETPGVAISVPVDTPFTEIDRILETQLANKTFPEDRSGPVDITVKRANVAAAGDRLLISLLINAREKRFFGVSAEATVHIWGKPVLDPTQQMLRLTDTELAVESEAAFGILGGAARAAMPYLQKELAEKAVLDLKPIANNLQRRIGALIAEYQFNEEGLRVASEISSLKLIGLAFDSKTLRITAAAEGLLNATVTALPKL